MSLAIITIEQEYHDLWRIEVEVGGTVCRRRDVRAQTFDEAVMAVIDAYRAFMPQDAQGPGPVVLQPLDRSNVVVPACPVGKRQAAKMRAIADGRPME